MSTTQLRVFEIDLTLGVPDSVWTVTAWTTREQTDSGKYTVRSDMKQNEFFQLLEELSCKLVRAHEAGADFVVMQTSGKYIVRDKNYPLPSHSASHVEDAVRAVANVTDLLTMIRAGLTAPPPAKRRRRR
jgi:hypothetical protein